MNHTSCQFRDKHTVGGIVFYKHAFLVFSYFCPHLHPFGHQCMYCFCTHWTTFSLRPYHVLKIQERGEDGVKMKQFRISKFPLRPYYVPATFLLRPHHVLTTSFTFPLRPQYALTKFIPFPLRPCYVLTKTKQFIPRANYVSSTF